MRKKANKLLALLTAVAITVTGVNVPANNASAASAKLSKKKITLTAGKKKTIYLKKGKKKLAIKSVKSSKKKVATVKKSGKKIIITAKKKGTATITVKAKVNKKVKSFKCKVTVKAKAKASAAPSAAASSAPASQAPASPVPSDAPSAVPSDAASAAPSADVSASPSADASAEPSAEPSKEPSKVTEIKLLNETALTNADGDKAYVYYDVLDQYGESMRTSVDIQWNTSPAGGKADKTLGRITIPKNSGSTATGSALQKFTYGEKIFVTGVHVKSGIVINESVTVGMAQAVDTIKLAGFVNKNDTTEILENLPKNFAKDTYYMLFQTFDQNGCPLDVTDEEYAAKNLTFVPDNPLLLSLQKDDAKTFFTIKGVDYAAMAVQPGDYVNKGGEANILVVANKTGTKSNINVVVGAMPQLKSLELLSPSETVADGDSWVKIPYVAKDTDGNTVTNYETIVRSNNTLSVSASDNTTLRIKEENDGTAGIYWSDASTYDMTNPANYANANVSDGTDRMIALTTIVVGGESNNTMLSVSDARIPTTITGTKDNNLKDYMANGHALGLDVTGGGTHFIYKDQYGKEFSVNPVNGANAKADAFFIYAGSTAFNGEYYGVRVDGTSDAKYGVEDNKIIKAGSSVTVTPTAVYNATNGEYSVNEATMKFSVAKSAASSTSDPSNWSDVAKAWSKTVYAVPVTTLKNSARISGLDSTLEVSVTGADPENAPTASPSAITVGNYDGGSHPYTFQIIGTYKNNDVNIPFGVGYVSADPDSFFAYTDGAGSAEKESKIAGVNVKVSVGTGSAVKTLTAADFYNTMAFGYPAKDKSLEAVFTITDENRVTANVSKDITVRAEEAVVSSLKFVSGGVLNPTNTSMASAAYDASLNGYDVGWKGEYHYHTPWDNSDTPENMTTGPVVYCAESWAHPGVPMFSTYDQYGHLMKADEIVYTISDLKENTDDLAHVSGNATIVNNGTATAHVEGAEIGDTFKVTAKVKGTTISDSCTITVGADTAAYISNRYNSDETFRKGQLNFAK